MSSINAQPRAAFLTVALGLLLAPAAAAQIARALPAQKAPAAQTGTLKVDPVKPPVPVVGEGQPLSVIPDLDNAVPTGNGFFWSELVVSHRAAFLKPHFVNMNLRPGDTLTIRSRTGHVVETLTGRGPKNHGNFWGLSAFGDELRLELSFAKPYGAPPFSIDEVIIGDPRMFEPAQSTESICSPEDFDDVWCVQGDADKWDNVFASVGVMTVGSNPTTGLWCSGSNVSPLNYVLTNDHCVSGQSGCDSAEFVFKYYRQGCNSSAPTTPDWVSFRCDTIVASSPLGSCDQGLNDLDFSLCAVIGDPASTFGYVTPDPIPLTDGEAIYIVQHPDGRPHEIAHGSGVDVDVDGTVLRYYNTLDTEGGSSGSPVFRESDDKLIGLHHCGGCSTPGVGNRGMLMSDIYPHIAPFVCSTMLDLQGSGAEGLAEVSGNGDIALDPGEIWEFFPRVSNVSCSDLGQGVTATVGVNSGSTGLVTMLQSSVSFGDIVAGSSVPSIGSAIFMVESATPCGAELEFDLTGISATNGGPFPDADAFFLAPVGLEDIDVAFTEDFTVIDPFWNVIDGGSGGGAAATWTTTNPGARSLGLTEPFMIVDSDEAGTSALQNEILETPVIDLTCFRNVTLQFTHNFRWFSGGGNEQCDVDVRSAATGGAWVNVANYSGGDASGMVEINLTPYAGGRSDVQVRFHYYNGDFDWWWAIDDVFFLADNGLVCEDGVAPTGGLYAPDRLQNNGPCD